jgi:hypothetical protein
MVTIRSLRVTKILGLVGGALRGRPIGGHRAVDEHQNVDAFTVTGRRPFPYQVDGDYLGEVTQLRFRYEPAIIDLVIP